MKMLSRNFSYAELACRCGCGAVPGPLFIKNLQWIRDQVEVPMKVTSGARCSEYNQRISTTGPWGPHVITEERFNSGEGAVDVLIYGSKALELWNLAHQCGFRGFGLRQHGPWHQRFLHMDNIWSNVEVPRPNLWTYHVEEHMPLIEEPTDD